MHQPEDDHDVSAICGINMQPFKVPENAQNPGFGRAEGTNHVYSSPSKGSADEDDRKEAAKAKTTHGMRTAWTMKWVSTRKKGVNASTPPSSVEAEGKHYNRRP